MNEQTLAPIVKAMYVWRMNQHKAAVGADTKARLALALEDEILEAARLIQCERYGGSS